jgi:hypothetical protein
MRIARHLAAPALLLLGSATAAQAAVEVRFVKPERYADASLQGGYGGKASAPTLKELRAYLGELGERYLAPDQRLDIKRALYAEIEGAPEPDAIVASSTSGLKTS